MFQTIVVFYNSQQTNVDAYTTLLGIADEQSLRWGGRWFGGGGDSPDHEDMAYAFNTREAADQWVACVKTGASTAGVVLDHIDVECELPGEVVPDQPLHKSTQVKELTRFFSELAEKRLDI